MLRSSGKELNLDFIATFLTLTIRLVLEAGKNFKDLVLRG